MKTSIKWSVLSFFIATLIFPFSLAYAQSLFEDVEQNAWYADAVNELSEKGIIEGHPDGLYHPEAPVNRAELAVILQRTMEYMEEGHVPKDSRPLLEEVKSTPLPSSVTLSVPFTSQAPHQNWDLPYAEACEEASLIMVEYYWREAALDADTADQEINKVVDWETEQGYGIDIGAATVAWTGESVYNLQGNVYFDQDVTLDNIKRFLASGYPVIIPAAGQTLAHPNYVGAGPPYHMIVLMGYDETGFYAHDPGSSAGESYHYSYDVVDEAIHDWNGSKSTVDSGRRAMVVFEP